MTIEDLTLIYCMIIDGMAASRQIKPSGLTYREIAKDRNESW